MHQDQGLYRGFALLYAHGPWARFSERVAEAFPSILERLDSGKARREARDTAGHRMWPGLLRSSDGKSVGCR